MSPDPQGEEGYPLIWKGEIEGGIRPVVHERQANWPCFRIGGYGELYNLEIEGANHKGVALDNLTYAMITNCVIHNNTQSGIQQNGGSPHVTIVDCNIYSNSGGINCLVLYGTNLISGNKIWGNTPSSGGNVYVGTANNGANDTLTIRNNLIYDNTSAGIYISAVYCDEDDTDTVNIYNNTIYNNGQDGIYCNADANGVAGVNVVNNITAGHNGTYDGMDSLNAITITYCDMDDDTGANVTEGTGCIDEDPQFVDEANCDFRLNKASPCVNAGDPGTTTNQVGTLDYWGNPRFVGIIDIGAYELPSLPQRTFITIY